MKRLNNFLPFLIVYLFLVGCNSAVSPEPTIATIESVPVVQRETRAIPNTNTPNAMTRQATATSTVEPTRTPFPTDTPSPEPLPTTPTTPRPTSSPTLSPSPTPTLYPDGWVAGFLYDRATSYFFVGNSSVLVYDSHITYESADEAVAEAIANIPLHGLAVFYGDYTPLGEHDGHMVVKRVEMVHLPYSEATPLSAVYSHPDNLFSFAYPEEWSLRVEDDGDTVAIWNTPPDKNHFSGPGLAYTDPTVVSLQVTIEAISLEAYMQPYLDAQQENNPYDEKADITVSEQEINGWKVVQIDLVNPPWGSSRYYALVMNERMVLVFHFSVEDALFAERALSTLELFGD